jgi:hypothetical protein
MGAVRSIVTTVAAASVLITARNPGREVRAGALLDKPCASDGSMAALAEGGAA